MKRTPLRMLSPKFSRSPSRVGSARLAMLRNSSSESSISPESMP